MKPGTIVEYIDHQKIITGVVLEESNNRLRILNEHDREIAQSPGRIFFASQTLSNYKGDRAETVIVLKKTVENRLRIKEGIDLKELWDLVSDTRDWIDLTTLTECYFPTPVTWDQKSAMLRTLFENRLYFKFDGTRFFPNSEEQIERIKAQEEEDKRKQKLIELGGNWIKAAINDQNPVMPPEFKGLTEILKSCYIFEKDSPYHTIGKSILTQAGVATGGAVFRFLVRLGVFDENENIDLHRMKTPRTFPESVLKQAESIHFTEKELSELPSREDYTHLHVITIDGQSTTDFDDALSLERIGDSFILGIHISDVAHFVKKDDPVDRQAFARGASIYMPDDKIPMLPSALSEQTASLKEGELRPCISVIVTLNRFFEIKDFEVQATLIRVNRQLSYSEVSAIASDDPDLDILIKIARAFREKRISSGATHITLPEVNVFLNETGISLNRVDRESPSRMMVSEMMIMGNWLMATLLARHRIPAVFRSQHEPKERIYRGETDSMFLNCLQRKFVNRAIIGHKPAFHAGLGLDAYVTATSPIRRYHDLVTQRQIRSVLGLESPYSDEDITRITHALEESIANVGKIQFNRKRYWLLKYMEGHIGQKTPAFVIDKKRNSYTVMLTEYMIEYNLAASGLKLKPGDSITLVISHANARKDSLSLYMIL
jgi:exoribonuclease-2